VPLAGTQRLVNVPRLSTAISIKGLHGHVHLSKIIDYFISYLGLIDFFQWQAIFK